MAIGDNSIQNTNTKSCAFMNMYNMLAAAEQANPSPPGVTEEWRHYVSTELRNFIVKKLVKDITSISDPDMQDEKIANLVAFAEEVEEDAYETANTLPEYYYMLAEGLKEKKQLQQVHQ